MPTQKVQRATELLEIVRILGVEQMALFEKLEAFMNVPFYP
jgi:hypothetical protein